MRSRNRFWGFTIFICFTAQLFAQQPTARAIMERVKAQDRTKDTTVEMKMELVNARGSKRERQLTQVTKTGADDNRKQLIRFLAPADIAGTGFLSIEHSDRDDDNYLYLPALRKTRRIAGSDKTDKFVGSEFSYEDLDYKNLGAYDYKTTGTEKTDGIDTWIVEATPAHPQKKKETGYSKRELWISQDHHLIVQAKFYDKKGKYVKLFAASEIRQVPGTEKWRPYRLTMADVLKGKKTVLDISDYKIDQGVQDNFFSTRYLKRSR